MDRGVTQGGSSTVREGAHRGNTRPPLRSGYCAVLVALFLVSSSVVLNGCSEGVRRPGIPAGAQTVLEAAIADIDAGRYDKLYNEAGDEWRKDTTLDESKATFQRLRDKLGQARVRNLETAREEQTGTAPIPGHSLVVIYQTSFDRGDAMETFTLIEHGDRWSLAKYFVSSTALK